MSQVNLSPYGKANFVEVYELVQGYNEDGEPTGKPKASVTLSWKPEEMKAAAEKDGEGSEAYKQYQQLLLMKKLADEASIERFGVKVGEEYAPDETDKTVASPFRSWKEKRKYYEEGEIFVKFSTQSLPGVVDQAKKPISRESGDFVSGNIAHVSYTVYAYDKAGNKGVAFGLNNVQKVAEGTPLSSRTKAEDDFETVGPSVKDDDIPF